jgi:hypothetical protein
MPKIPTLDLDTYSAEIKTAKDYVNKMYCDNTDHAICRDSVRRIQSLLDTYADSNPKFNLIWPELQVIATSKTRATLILHSFGFCIMATGAGYSYERSQLALRAPVHNGKLLYDIYKTKLGFSVQRRVQKELAYAGGAVVSTCILNAKVYFKSENAQDPSKKVDLIVKLLVWDSDKKKTYSTQAKLIDGKLMIGKNEFRTANSESVIAHSLSSICKS